jgi:hypothetical protein
MIMRIIMRRYIAEFDGNRYKGNAEE